MVMEKSLSLERSYAAYFETIYYTRQRILEIALLILFSRGLELKWETWPLNTWFSFDTVLLVGSRNIIESPHVHNPPPF